MDWFKISLLLCFFGFLKEMRPSENFVIDYLTHPWRNITAEEVNKYLYPINTFSTPVFLLIILFITDFLRYKPVIIACGVVAIANWSLLVWTTSFEAIIASQLLFGIFVATEVAYYTYIYAKVDKEHYLKVTSHTRAAILAGRCISGILAQFLFYFELTDLRGLNAITLAMMVMATFWALCLPRVTTSLYFNTKAIEGEPTGNGAAFANAFGIIKYQVKTAYTNRLVVLWSVWYVMAVCGSLQVFYYVQMLWIHIDNRPEVMWNGAVEAFITLSCATVALLASRVRRSVLHSSGILWGLVIIAVCQGAIIFVFSNTSNRFISYAVYTLYYLLHTFTITISSAEVAKRLPEDSYGLIFGINTFIALILQCVLTLVVVTDVFGFDFNIVQQFNIYACCYVVLGISYLVPIKFRMIHFEQDVPVISKSQGNDNISFEQGGC